MKIEEGSQKLEFPRKNVEVSIQQTEWLWEGLLRAQ